MTVVREIPSRSAMRAFGTPSAASRLISAQSSKVITLQSSSVHFSSASLLSSFRASSTAVLAAVEGSLTRESQIDDAVTRTAGTEHDVRRDLAARPYPTATLR